MNAKQSLVLNAIINCLVLYAIGRAIKGHKAGVRLGLIGGLLSSFAVYVVDTRTPDPD